MIKRTLDDAKEFAYKNPGAPLIKQMMQKSNVSVQELAKRLEIKPQSLSTKLYRDRFTLHEILIITYLLECDVFFSKDNQRIY